MGNAGNMSESKLKTQLLTSLVVILLGWPIDGLKAQDTNNLEYNIKFIEGLIPAIRHTEYLRTTNIDAIQSVMHARPQTIEELERSVFYQKLLQQGIPKANENLKLLYKDLMSIEGCQQLADDVFTMIKYFRKVHSTISQSTINDIEMLRIIHEDKTYSVKLSEHMDSMDRILNQSKSILKFQEELEMSKVMDRLEKAVILEECP
jgi:hypothetical protein